MNSYPTYKKSPAAAARETGQGLTPKMTNACALCTRTPLVVSPPRPAHTMVWRGFCSRETAGWASRAGECSR